MVPVIKLHVRQPRLNLQRLRERSPRAISRALNRSIASGRTFMAREIAKDMGLKVSTVRDRIRLVEARPGQESARLEASLKRIPLIDFGARGPEPSRGRGKGVTARTRAKRYPNAFIATMHSGHRGVFRRVVTKRLPIVELFERSIGYVFNKFKPAGMRRAVEQLQKNLQHEFRFALRGR